jgi:hypothetical protein
VGRPLSDEQRAILIAELSAGASLREAARAAGVSKHAAEVAAASLAVLTQIRGTPEWLRRRVWELVDARFDSLIAASRLAADEDYLRQYSPSEVATFIGVVDDKLVRLLAAVGRGRGEEPDRPALPGPSLGSGSGSGSGESAG